MNLDIPFKLFACCFPVSGKERALICDVQRNLFEFIPLALFEILEVLEGKTLNEVKLFFNHLHDDLIEEYFYFLENKEFIFFTETPGSFPKMDLRWEEPCILSNAIVDIGDQIELFDWKKLASEFEALRCRYIQIRSFKVQSLCFFEKIIQEFDDTCVESMELVIKFGDIIDEDGVVGMCKDFHRIHSIYVHSAPIQKVVHIAPQRHGHVFFTDEVISNVLQCGNILSDYFASNIKHYTEAQKNNTCLNRKIAIDIEGNIKNCPSMKESFGNIRDTTLQEALEKPGFKKYWNITKDQIQTCKDCEFRYICTDCRAYLEAPEDIYSKPLKCGYNPYTCEWEEWSTNPLKQKAIAHYGMESLKADAGPPEAQ